MKVFLTSVGPALVAGGIGILIAKVVELKTVLDELDDAQRQLAGSRNAASAAQAILGQVQGLEAAARSGLQNAQTVLDFVRDTGGDFDELAKRLELVQSFRVSPSLPVAVRLMDEFGLAAEKVQQLALGSAEVQAQIERFIETRKQTAAQARAQAILEREVGEELDKQVEAIEKLAARRNLGQQFDDTETAGKEALARVRAEIAQLEADAAGIRERGVTEEERARLADVLQAREVLLAKERNIQEVLQEQLATIRERIQAETAQQEATDAAKKAADQALFAEIERRDALQTRTDLTSQLNGLAREEQDLRGQIAAGTLAEEEGLERIAALRREAIELQRQQLDAQIAAAELVAAGDPTVENLRTLNELLAQRNALDDQAASEELRARTEAQTLAQREQEQALADLIEQYREYVAVTNQVVGHPLGGFFDDLLTGTKSASEAFDDFVRGVVRNFTRMVAQLLAQKAILAAVGLFFPGAGAGTAVAGAIARNSGGPVPGGGPNRDSVLAALTPGEYVIQRPAVRALGLGVMEMINRGMLPTRTGGPTRRSLPKLGFATGGQVTSQDGAGSTRIVPVQVASESALEQMLAGGTSALTRHLRENASQVKAALGLI